MTDNVAAPVATAPAGTSAMTAPITSIDTTSQPITTASETISQPTGQINDSWYSNIKDSELRGYAETKGFKSNEDVLAAYKSIDELGNVDKAKNIIKLPTDENDTEGYENLYKALGRPDKAADYNLTPEGQQKTEFNEVMENALFEAGIPLSAAQKLATTYNEMATKLQAAKEQQFLTESSNQMEALKQEWGSNSDRNIEMARRGKLGLGISDEEVQTMEQSLGTKRMMELFKNAASGMAEDSFHSANSNSAFMSPEGARAELNRLVKDKAFGQSMMNGDVAAQEKYERLNRLALGKNG